MQIYFNFAKFDLLLSFLVVSTYIKAKQITAPLGFRIKIWFMPSVLLLHLF